MLSKEDVAAKKEFITRGMSLTCDAGGPVSLGKSASGSDLPAIRARIDALAAKVKEAAEIARRA